ncbi:MAG: hypothetical protein IJZ94_00480 [Clostridia bacterium]|nr:hypothetical protein [Clostridia bacterium]
MLKDLLDTRKDLQKHLFVRGFMITNDKFTVSAQFPFYGNWKQQKIGNYTFCVHNLQQYYFVEREGKTFFLIGHAYNPYTMDYEEEVILTKIAEAYSEDREVWLNFINELTGLFIIGYTEGDNAEFLLDASGMQYACYGVFNKKIYIASHMQLLDDLLDLKKDPYIEKLIRYKWYKYVFGNYFPGDLTRFVGLRRVIPNTFVRFEKGRCESERFYPKKNLDMCKNEDEYMAVVHEAADIMRNTMLLISKKWKDAGISLTGGVDSNTTLAAAKGLYDKFTSFSYVALPYERVDAEAAEVISKAVGIEHKTIYVPERNEDIRDFEAFSKILLHNDGYIGRMKDPDVRKKIFLMQENVCDIEVKSWISETVRAYAYKYYGRKTMPKNMKPRHYSALYKMFFFRRTLLYKTDKAFEKYIADTKIKEHLFNYDESDLFVWEMMHGGKCSTNIGTMRFCFDITIPYNNRNLIDLLLRVQLEDRLSDRHHLDMKKYLNEDITALNICVANENQTFRRKRLLNTIYRINTILPF